MRVVSIFSKIVSGIVVSALLLSGCAADPAASATPSGEPTMAASSATPTPTQTAAPTATPEPSQLTEEELRQIEIEKRVSDLEYYFETYKDEYAPTVLRMMFEAGEITEEQYTSSVLFEEVRYYDAEQFAMWVMGYEDDSKILNGEYEELDESSVSMLVGAIAAHMEDGTVLLSLFNTEEKRNRVIAGLNLIDAWVADPTDVNREAMEDMYFSEELMPGEVIMLYDRLVYSEDELESIEMDGTSYTVSEYSATVLPRFGTSWGQRDIDAIETLKVLNNTPNSEKEWLTGDGEE